MKFFPWKYYMIAGFAINIFLAVLMLVQLDKPCDCSYEKTRISYIHIKDNEHKFELLNTNISALDLSKTIAVISREFELFENDLPETIKSITNILPKVKIYIISDNIPYPPLSLSQYDENFKIINLNPAVGNPLSLHQPLNIIDQDHIFIIPDSVRLDNISQFQTLLKYHYESPHDIIAAPVDGEKSLCFLLNISLRYWTMKFKKNFESSECNALEGKHVLLVAKSLLMQFSHPFSKPFSYSLFIQATLLKKKVKLAKDIIFKRGKDLFTDEHSQWKSKRLEAERKVKIHEDLGIKKIIYPASKVEWYGCNKNSNRCFGTVVNNMPEYLFNGRWTPPCCLENLRLTARYVFGILEKCNVRYWLEGGSLLGAVRTGDIIPWDYDVDIGIYREDITKCEWLKNSLQQSIVDTQGFVWEKATEGDFIRVQFSQSNHLHVDIFPFYSRNGTMTKDTWFVDHKQDMEFPEHFLKPLYKIKFVGVIASAPNNYKTFLEMKFGKGVIEKPEYPDPKVLKFNRKSQIQ